MIDRLKPRARPSGRPIMYQTWGKLLFLHWRVPAASLRQFLPEGLELDSYEGQCWVGLTPFTMWGIRPPFLPALPVVSDSHELNMRTYVHHRGEPGVWFFSLDASNALAVPAARAAYHLPYFHAEMSLEEEGAAIHFTSRRRDDHGPPAEFDARWTRTGPLSPPDPRSLTFFLVERYVLYSADGKGRLHRARIHHKPWPLRGAELHSLHSTMLLSRGISQPSAPPLLHAHSDPLDVEIWPVERVETG
jgi:uncharacterized protein